MWSDIKICASSNMDPSTMVTAWEMMEQPEAPSVKN